MTVWSLREGIVKRYDPSNEDMFAKEHDLYFLEQMNIFERSQIANDNEKVINAKKQNLDCGGKFNACIMGVAGGIFALPACAIGGPVFVAAVVPLALIGGKIGAWMERMKHAEEAMTKVEKDRTVRLQKKCREIDKEIEKISNLKSDKNESLNCWQIFLRCINCDSTQSEKEEDLELRERTIEYLSQEKDMFNYTVTKCLFKTDVKVHHY